MDIQVFSELVLSYSREMEAYVYSLEEAEPRIEADTTPVLLSHCVRSAQGPFSYLSDGDR